MITFTYNGFDFSDLVTVHEIIGRGTLPSEASSIEVRGRDGLYVMGKRRKERPIEVKMSIQSASPGALRILTDYFNEMIDLDELAPLVFSDEPTMEYMAFIVGEVDWTEIRGFAIMTVTFLCPDPYKYGPPITTPFANGAVSVTNNGTIPVSPIVEATVLSEITYMDVFTDEAYMRIGQPVPVGGVKFTPKSTILSDNFADTVGWGSAGTAVDGGAVSGTIASTGYSLRATSFGVPTAGVSWHGPAIKTSLSSTLTDFQVDWRLQFNTDDAQKRGRIEMYLLDDQSNVIAKMAMKRIGGGTRGNMVEIRVGNGVTNYFMMNYTADNGTAWNDFDGIIRLSRTDNVWDAYVAQIDTKGKHHTRSHRIYKDSERLHMDSLAQMQLHFGKSATSEASNMYSHDLKVYRLNKEPESIPVIATIDDIITFDFTKSLVAINGEPRPDLKDMGARFFKLSKGVSTLLIEPSDKLTATLTLREAFK